MKPSNKNIFRAVFLGSLITASTCLAQDTTTKNNPLTFSGYAEVYYIQDFNRPLDNKRPAFVYSHNRANEVNLNLAFIKAAYSSKRVRANLALATGTYMNANYAAEPDVMKNIYEASVGVKLSENHNLWIDAGIMPSHVGFESAVGKDNWTLTRNLSAENSPYFETGVKIAYTTKNEKWYVAALYLNGWQGIQRVDGNSTPAFGAQISYKPSAKLTLNYSAFAGSDQPDSLRKMRYFHNLYGIFQLNNKFGITAGVDFGMEQKEKAAIGFNKWYTPVIIARYNPSERVNIAARAEYYSDKNGVIITTGISNGFGTFGVSANVDYLITSNVVWRIEARNFSGKDNIFTQRNGSMASNNTSITTALAISF